MAQFVEALLFKQEGRGLPSLLGSLGLFIPSGCTMAVGSTHPLTEWVPGVSPGCKGGRDVRLTTLPPTSADCLEILGSCTYWNPRPCPDQCRDFLTLHRKKIWRNPLKLLCEPLAFGKSWLEQTSWGLYVRYVSQYLTFRWPCIVINSYNKTEQMD
jgi:hypothetical protein